MLQCSVIFPNNCGIEYILKREFNQLISLKYFNHIPEGCERAYIWFCLIDKCKKMNMTDET